MRELDVDELLDLVGGIYDVALSPDGWDSLLERVTEVFAGSGTIFFVKDRQEAGLEFAHLYGLPGVALEEYQQHFAAVDVGIETLLTTVPGSVITHESIPADVYRKSEIYNDFRCRWESEQFVAGDVFRDARRFGILAVQGSRSRATFGPVETTLIGRLLPHLRRAVQLKANLELDHSRQRVMEDVVEGLRVGVVVLDDRGEILLANAAAKAIVAQGDGLHIRRGRLRAASPMDDRTLQKLVTSAAATARRTDPAGGGAFAVTRPSGGQPYPVLVSPGPGLDSGSAFRTAATVVLIGDPGAGLEAGSKLVERLYGLTPGEARLARAVASGETLESYAATQGIEVSTARWTIKSILAKTGARRQADLVRLLLTGPAGASKPSEDSPTSSRGKPRGRRRTPRR